MELQLFGINHRTSNVSERERFIVNELNQVLLKKHLDEKFGDELDSFFGLSTCNRTEVYLIGKKGISKSVLQETKLFLRTANIPDSSFYFFDNQNALVHMAKVASGIDSHSIATSSADRGMSLQSAIRDANKREINTRKLKRVTK